MTYNDVFRGGWGHDRGPAETDYMHRRPEVGDVVAWNYAAWEVTHVKEAEDRLEDEVHCPRGREPYVVGMVRLHGPKHEFENSRHEVHIRRRSGRFFHTYPDGRVPLCSCHGYPWPCRDYVETLHARKEAEKAEHEMRLLPGCCPACQEPVTGRQQSIAFPGPYLRNPLADENPVFHLRRKCHWSAVRYEEEWVAEDPTRPRSLLTLRCEGTLTIHRDGSAECHGRTDGRECPTVYARHRGFHTCYLLDPCPLGCEPGEFGSNGSLLGRPKHPRDITRVENP